MYFILNICVFLAVELLTYQQKIQREQWNKSHVLGRPWNNFKSHIQGGQFMSRLCELNRHVLIYFNIYYCQPKG